MIERIDPERLKELRDACSAAYQHSMRDGIWSFTWDADEKAWLILDENESVIATVHDCGAPSFSAHANARAIASCSPARLLELLHYVKHLEQEVEALKPYAAKAKEGG